MDYHAVDENNPHFIELFKPNTIEKKWKICTVKFDSARLKKSTCFCIIMDSRLEEVVDPKLAIYL